MNIVAKTILDKKQIDAKIKKGYETFEIQLLDEYYDEDFSFDETLIKNCDIMSVHTPLVSGDETTIG